MNAIERLLEEYRELIYQQRGAFYDDPRNNGRTCDRLNHKVDEINAALFSVSRIVRELTALSYEDHPSVPEQRA